jgi:type IV secretion system protein VirD4
MAAILSLAEARAASINEHLYLGEHEGLTVPPQRLVYRGPKHLLCFGPSRSRKSTALCIPNLMRKRRSIICFDPKGELTAMTARRRAELGRLMILDPFNLMPELVPERKEFWEKHRFHWNSLAHLDMTGNPDAITDARSLAEGLVDREVGSSSKFFEDSMENMITALALWERIQRGKAASWRNIRRELASPTLVDTFDQMRKSNVYALQVAGDATYGRLTDKKSQTTSLKDVMATILKNTAFLDDDRIGEDMFEGEAMPFAEMHKEIISVFIVLPLGQLTKQSKWLRQFVNLAVNVFLRAAPRAGEAKLPPVLMMLDEFGNVGRLTELLNVLNVSAALRLQIAFFLQTVEQLKVSYPKEWTYFFAGSGAWTTFAARDPETAQVFSDLIGKTETVITAYNDGESSQSASTLRNMMFPQKTTSSGASRSLHIHKLVEPEDMLRLRPGKTINFIDAEPMPIRGNAPGYWELTHDLPGLDPNPYHHG